ncbi:hypothetical protein RCH14_004055 [Massilia sp. MP_M2]|uniref:hypothetical protein n=1 Tax=Massilia sp. MP_M2 TaxID=3071713 RepID=UPI00319E76DD
MLADLCEPLARGEEARRILREDCCGMAGMCHAYGVKNGPGPSRPLFTQTSCKSLAMQNDIKTSVQDWFKNRLITGLDVSMHNDLKRSVMILANRVV